MAGAASQRFLPVEVVTVFGGAVVVGLRLHHLRHYHSLPTELSSHLLTRTFVLAHLLGYDVLSALQGLSGRIHTITHKPQGSLLGVAFALLPQYLCQRLQAQLSRHLCTGAAFRTEGQVDILQLGSLPTVGDTPFQLRGHLAQFGNGLHHRFLALGYFLEPFQLFTHGCYLHLIHASRAFLTVARDEGNGATFFQQAQCACHILFL